MAVRIAREVDGRDFADGQAVVIEPDDWAYPRWMLWHIRPDDGPEGWVRSDWLTEVEQGFRAYGEQDEIAVEGFNIWTAPDGSVSFERPADKPEEEVAS
jgi:hypothetical protein